MRRKFIFILFTTILFVTTPALATGGKAGPPLHIPWYEVLLRWL